MPIRRPGFPIFPRGDGLPPLRRELFFSFKGAPVDAFSPATLFANGEDGIVILPGTSHTDFYVERTGASATTLAGEGDSVGTVHDKVLDRYFVAPDDTRRMKLERDGAGLWHLKWDGVNDLLEGSVSFPSSGMSFAVAALYPTDYDDGQSDIFHTHDGTSASGTRFRLDFGTANKLHLLNFDGGGSLDLDYVDGFTGFGSSFVASGFLSDSVQKGWYNGALKFDETNALVGMDTTGIVFGNDYSGADEFDGRLYGCIMTDREWTTAERQDVEALLAAQSGVDL
jgi:hypothetical protein